MINVSSYFFSLQQFAHAILFEDDPYPWIALQRLENYLKKQTLGVVLGEVSQLAHLINPESIFIGEGSRIESGAYIKGPCIIGKGCEVRHDAYIRGNVLIGDHCVVGHGSELKNTILMNHSHAAHFAYLGDSIIGNGVNLGAGSKCANVRIDKKYIKIRSGSICIETNMRKLGAIIGDRSQLGCNAVTNPGTLIGQDVFCYPNIAVGGVILSRSLIKPNITPCIVSY